MESGERVSTSLGEGSVQVLVVSIIHSLVPTIVTGGGWVGWTDKKAPLRLTFIFHSLQAVNGVTIAVYNEPSMGIVVSTRRSN